jgi:hypothetical protein
MGIHSKQESLIAFSKNFSLSGYCWFEKGLRAKI